MSFFGIASPSHPAKPSHTASAQLTTAELVELPASNNAVNGTSFASSFQLGDPSLQLSAILIFLLSSIFALTCWVTPMTGEDYGLAIPLREHSLGHIAPTIVKRSLGQIEHWNARFGEQLAILWINSPKWLFVVSETLAFVALTFLTAAIALRSITFSSRFVRLWSLSVCLFYLLWPRFETFFWMTGGSEYLQPLAVTLLVLLPFAVADADLALATPLRFGGMLFAGLLAGASFENAGPGLLLYMGVRLWTRTRWRKASPRLGGVMTAYGIGWTALMTAPSTRIRSEYYRAALNLPSLSPGMLLHRAAEVWRVSNRTNALLIVGLGALSIVMLLRQGERPSLQREDWLLLAAGLVPALIVIAAPYTEPRAFQLLAVILIVMILRFALQLQRTHRLQHMLRWGSGILALTFSLGVFALYRNFAVQVSARSAAIMQASKTSECASGIPISLIGTGVSNRLLNSREVWVERSLNQVEDYFGCRLVLVPESSQGRTTFRLPTHP